MPHKKFSLNQASYKIDFEKKVFFADILVLSDGRVSQSWEHIYIHFHTSLASFPVKGRQTFNSKANFPENRSVPLLYKGKTQIGAFFLNLGHTWMCERLLKFLTKIS